MGRCAASSEFNASGYALSILIAARREIPRIVEQQRSEILMQIPEVTMRRNLHPISVDLLMQQPRPARPDVRVSDHAIVRWLERVEGLDLDIIRAEILAVAGPAAAAGAKVLRKDGHAFIMEKGAIVTILPDDRRRLPQRR